MEESKLIIHNYEKDTLTDAEKLKKVNNIVL